MVVEVLESTVGLGLRDVRIRFLGEPLHFAVGPGLLGRVFNGVGQPVDGGPPVAAASACASTASDQSDRARAAEGLHRDRRHRDRPDEQPGARAEAAAVLRRRPAA